MEKHIQLSRFISLILRHKPEVVGLSLDSQGYLNVDSLIKGVVNSGRFIDKQILDEIVESDDKQRYSYNMNKTSIRANQGHSIKVDLGLARQTPPKVLYHGTALKFKDSILSEGLNKKSREYVHLTDNIDTAISVGSRRGEPVIFEVDSEKMDKNGCEFLLSENNVWLVDKVPSEFILIVKK